MKQLLFLVIALLLIGNKAVNAQMNTSSKAICLEKREKPKGIGNEESFPAGRSLVIQPAYAYIYNHVVSVDFPYEMPSVAISLTNLSTGEVIHSDAYASPSQISLDLSQEAFGEYYLEIVFDGFYFCGQFTL